MSRAERRPQWSPLVVTRLRRNPHGFFTALKREQGDVASVRFGGDNLFLVSHPEEVQRVLVTDDGDFPRLNVAVKRWRRRPRRQSAGVTLGPGGDPELRLAFRRALQPTYSRGRVDACWAELLRIADEKTSGWSDRESIDLVEEIEPLTLELVTRAVFGQPLDMPIHELVARTSSSLAVRKYASSAGYRLADRLRLRRNLKAMSAYEALVDLMRQHLEERRSQAALGDDVLSRLLAVEEVKGLGDEQLVLEALGQLFVGSEPVGSTASWALCRLAGEPEMRDRVRGEFEASCDDPKGLAYLHAVLSETLRLHPPFTLIGRQARTDLEVGGRRVRRGEPVIVCPYLIHRDARWWPDALRFDPERWLNGGAGRPRLAYLPFGAGPRRCLGEHVAWRGAEATIATALSRWELSPLGESPKATAIRPSGVRIRLERRG